MASLSQRRDLDDPSVIRKFAQQMENPEILALLTILTFVDALATSDNSGTVSKIPCCGRSTTKPCN